MNTENSAYIGRRVKRWAIEMCVGSWEFHKKKTCEIEKTRKKAFSIELNTRGFSFHLMQKSYCEETSALSTMFWGEDMFSTYSKKYVKQKWKIKWEFHLYLTIRLFIEFIFLNFLTSLDRKFISSMTKAKEVDKRRELCNVIRILVTHLSIFIIRSKKSMLQCMKSKTSSSYQFE